MFAKRSSHDIIVVTLIFLIVLVGKSLSSVSYQDVREGQCNPVELEGLNVPLTIDHPLLCGGNDTCQATVVMGSEQYFRLEAEAFLGHPPDELKVNQTSPKIVSTNPKHFLRAVAEELGAEKIKRHLRISSDKFGKFYEESCKREDKTLTSMSSATANMFVCKKRDESESGAVTKLPPPLLETTETVLWVNDDSRLYLVYTCYGDGFRDWRVILLGEGTVPNASTLVSQIKPILEKLGFKAENIRDRGFLTPQLQED